MSLLPTDSMTEILEHPLLSPTDQLKMRADLFARICLTFPSYSSYRDWVGHPVKSPTSPSPSRAALQRSFRISRSLSRHFTFHSCCESEGSSTSKVVKCCRRQKFCFTGGDVPHKLSCESLYYHVRFLEILSHKNFTIISL